MAPRVMDQHINQADALFRRGLALHEMGRLDEASLLYERALQRQPQHAGALHLLGLIAFHAGQPERAAALIGDSLLIDPRCVTAHNHRGNALLALRQYDAAIASYDKAIELKRDYAEAYYNRGNALLDTQRYDAAVDSFDLAVRHKSDHAEAHYNRGLALAAMKSYQAAIASFDVAIFLRPGFAGAHENRGIALFWLGEHEAAIQSFDAAITIDQRDANTHYQRGNALRALGRHAAAIASYDRALEINPGYKFLYGLRLHTKMEICSWDDLPAGLAELTARIERGQAASPPLPVLGLTDSAALQRMAAGIWVGEACPPNGALPAIQGRSAHHRIRVGYFSVDFRDHAVSALMAGVFETHDRDRFDITAFSFGPAAPDAMRTRLQGAFDRFIDVRERSDYDIALLARNMRIDIAVDLGGFTEGCRPNIFALRAAPLQLSYIGYLGTMAAEYMDYLVADATIIPPEHREQYSEKIIYLPHYQANDAGRVMVDREFGRAELGLPESGFVFCCFNTNAKILPDTFNSWMRILGKVPGSVLFLYAENAAAEDNLRREAARSGIKAERIVFGGRLPAPAYLARYRTADLFLDTLPYNAGTTASDALWAGLPVLTCTGRAFAARIAASLLMAIGLPELIVSTQEHYESLAVELASHPERLHALKQRLAVNRHTKPLFDTPRFTRHLEAAYSQIHTRYLSGLPADHVFVQACPSLPRSSAT